MLLSVRCVADLLHVRTVVGIRMYAATDDDKNASPAPGHCISVWILGQFILNPWAKKHQFVGLVKAKVVGPRGGRRYPTF